METFILTTKELNFVNRFFEINGCGAETWGELLEDNYSYQEMSDLKAAFPEYNEQQIGAFITNLLSKGVFQEDYSMKGLFYITEKYIKYRVMVDAVPYS